MGTFLNNIATIMLEPICLSLVGDRILLIHYPTIYMFSRFIGAFTSVSPSSLARGSGKQKNRPGVEKNFKATWGSTYLPT